MYGRGYGRRAKSPGFESRARRDLGTHPHRHSMFLPDTSFFARVDAENSELIRHSTCGLG